MQDKWKYYAGYNRKVSRQTTALLGQGCSLDGHLMSFRRVHICFSRHEWLLQYFHEEQLLNLWARLGYFCCVVPSTVHDDPRSRKQLWCLSMPRLKVYWTHSGFLRVSGERGWRRWLICPWWNLTAEAVRPECPLKKWLYASQDHVSENFPGNWQDGTVVGALRFWAFALV